jgi:hypothetical protein
MHVIYPLMASQFQEDITCRCLDRLDMNSASRNLPFPQPATVGASFRIANKAKLQQCTSSSDATEPVALKYHSVKEKHD